MQSLHLSSLAVIATLALLWVGSAHAASFDCTKAAAKVEKLICADPAVSELDSSLANEYKAAQMRDGAPAALKTAQLAWLKSKRNTCADIACLHSVYEARLAELSKDRARFSDAKSAIAGTCAAMAAAIDADPGDCHVTESGSFGKVGETDQLYATYCLDAPRNDEYPCELTGIALFEIDPQGRAQRWLQRIDPDGLGNQFSKPELLQKHEGLFLDVPVSVPGTGAFNASTLYRRDGARWVEIDVTGWEKDLAAKLPKGLEVWKGIWPDYATMTATTGLYRAKDGNCCPTGGTAEITLRFDGNRLSLATLKIGPPPR